MKQYEWNEGLNNIDPELVNEHFKKKNELTKRKIKRAVLLRIGAMAACICLIVGAILAIPRPDYNPPDNSGDGAISAPLISAGEGLTGLQEKVYGSLDFMEPTVGDIPGAGFFINTVLHVRVAEVLPDTYYVPDVGYGAEPDYHVARLSVIESLRGEGIPDEIYLKFSYYPKDVIEGFDSLIITLSQVGVENYLMINRSKNEITYFPNMFSVTGPDDLLYGGVIAINDGSIDESFWDKYRNKYGGKFGYLLSDPEFDYPATHGSSLDDIKERVKKLIADCNEVTADYVYAIKPVCDYYTADDIFTSDEAKAVRDYIAPSSNSTFAQSITINNDRVIGFYTRLIGGFVTEERIIVNGYTGEVGNVLREGNSYSHEDFLRIPDLGSKLNDLDLKALKPTHLSDIDNMEIKYAIANGFYRKGEGRVYGIIRILLFCVDPEDNYGFYMDDCYYLYNDEGVGREVQRDELRAVIGDDFIISSFTYGVERYYLYC